MAVEGGGTAVLGQVLTGMGGVGKTQIAADYALTAWDNSSGERLDVLVWVTASSRSALLDGYGQAARELCGADSDKPEQAARTFLAWLTPKAGARPCRWLVVLDDVADPDDLRGLWPPASRHGRCLVTTRCRDSALAGEDRRLIEVGLFTPAEAVAYLIAALAAHGPTTPHQAVRVHQLIQRVSRDFLTPDQRDRLAQTAGDALFAVWPAIDRDSSLAQALRANADALTACAEDALYRPNGTHLVLLLAGRSLASAGHFQAAVDHGRNVADAARDRLGPMHSDTRAAHRELAVHLGLAGEPASARATVTEVLEQELRTLPPDDTDVMATRFLLARYLGETGEPSAATATLAALLPQALRVWGPDHTNTLAIRSALAVWQAAAGDLAGASQSFSDLFQQTTRLSDPEESVSS
ncbi:NB-ARC domain-containing protein [Streptomyces sp. NPDC056161]|uniref:NB-ARC domain-containing protein n=1 Tax=Streptomyces sp. NPDC056161 TaxID=3345732 RepID=UPI0035E05D78